MLELYSCPIKNVEKHTNTAFTVTVECKELAAQARAGQFVHISCGEARLLRRPVSICGAEEDLLRFVFEIKGEGTRWLAARRPGQELSILGPLGNGFNMPDGKIIVVGGGVGAPPMLYAAKSARGAVTAVLGFRDSSRIMLRNEFEAICNRVYLTTDDGSCGVHGPVTKPLEELLANGTYDAVLACGPRAMLSAVAALCERYDMPCQVSMEERMGCGVGACLVCACKTVKDGKEHMSRVCRDGPVFYAEEVVW